MKRSLLVVFAVAFPVALFLWALIDGTLSQQRYRVEVCMDFQGRTNCATAAGPSQEQALRTATQTACALLASGMTESMACDRTPPKSVRWIDRTRKTIP